MNPEDRREFEKFKKTYDPASWGGMDLEEAFAIHQTIEEDRFRREILEEEAEEEAQEEFYHRNPELRPSKPRPGCCYCGDTGEEEEVAHE